MNSRAIEEAQCGWARKCVGNELGLWWAARDVRERLPGASEEEIRRETLAALRPLLRDGTLRAADAFPNGAFRPWRGSVEEQLARIDSEWRKLGRRPTIGDIVWFIGRD